MRRALMTVTAAVSLVGTALPASAGPALSAPTPRTPGSATTEPGDLGCLLDQLLAAPPAASSQIVVLLPLPVTG